MATLDFGGANLGLELDSIEYCTKANKKKGKIGHFSLNAINWYRGSALFILNIFSCIPERDVGVAVRFEFSQAAPERRRAGRALPFLFQVAAQLGEQQRELPHRRCCFR